MVILVVVIDELGTKAREGRWGLPYKLKDGGGGLSF